MVGRDRTDWGSTLNLLLELPERIAQELSGSWILEVGDCGGITDGQQPASKASYVIRFQEKVARQFALESKVHDDGIWCLGSRVELEERRKASVKQSVRES